MDDRFDKEFYKSPWHRVLPVGPGGIQPFVRTGHPAAGPQHRLPAVLRALARGLREVVGGLGAFGAFGRWGATGSPGQASLAHATRPGQPALLRPSRAAPRRATGPTPPRPLRKAA